MKIRNKLPGPLVIADAKLRLAPGEVVEVGTVTPQTQGALDRGLAAQVDETTPVGAPELPKPAPDQPADYQNLSRADAIEYIDEVDDPAKLEAILASERRKTVREALERRLQEVKASAAK